MRVFLFLAVLVCACYGETFEIAGGEVFTVGVFLQEDRNSVLKMSTAGEERGSCTVEIKDPKDGVIRTFRNEQMMDLSFVPKTSGEYPVTVTNTGRGKVSFTVVVPETDEGPFASQVEINLGRDLEDLLKRIINAHKSLLVRQTEHLEKAKATKSWIKKLTIFEVGLCMLALYYVHTEAVKTFYSTRKM